jgi:hypothetical protein
MKARCASQQLRTRTIIASSNFTISEQTLAIG